MLEEVWEMLLQSRKTAQLGRGGVVSYAFTENKIVLIEFNKQSWLGIKGIVFISFLLF